MTEINESTDHDLALARDFSRLIAGFLGADSKHVWSRLQKEFHEPGSTVAEAWQKAAPKTPAEITRFYQETEGYIYDLAADHCRRRRRPVEDAILGRIARHCSRVKIPPEGGTTSHGLRVLVYGDGIGSDSLTISRLGHLVTYFDVPGTTLSFACYRFENETPGQKPVAVLRKEEIPAGAFDVVVCIEVLEHVPDPPGVMREIHRALKPGGIALITESFESIGPDFPSHLPENFQYAGKTHRMMEEIGFANTYYNTDPLNYPMEFTRIAPGLPGELLVFKHRVRRAVDTRLRRWRN